MPSAEERVRFIDGLRGIAILGVVAFHSGLPYVLGGFLGVDIFFVLSGYLIIGMIQRQMDRRDFSLLRFYCARALRIGPPLLLVVFFTLAVAALIDFSPFELKWFGRSGAAVLALLPNIFFEHEFGYFGPLADQQPFLHIWSLGVEEQFYLVVPVALIAIGAATGPRFRLGGVALVSVLSLTFVGSLAFFLNAPYQAAFYLMPSRMWEFAAGGLVALPIATKWRAPAPAVAVTLYAGLALILAPLLFAGSSFRFPGPIGIAPVVGTAAVLWAGRTNHNQLGLSILAHPILVGIGLISYSWYLWHWSLLVLLRTYVAGHSNTLLDFMFCAIGGAAIAVVTYIAVERPLREFRHSSQFVRLSKWVLPATACIVGLSIALCFGFEKEMSARASEPQFSALRDALADPIDQICHETDVSKDAETLAVCPLGEGDKSVVLWGDSLAGSLVYGASEFAKSAGVRVILIWKAGCVPLLGVDIAWLGVLKRDCSSHNNAVANLLRNGAFGHSPGLIIASAWLQYGERGNLVAAVPAGSDQTNVDYDLLLRHSLDDTLQNVSQSTSHVVLVGPPPMWRYPIPSCEFAVRARTLGSSYCTLARQAVSTQRMPVAQTIERVSAKFPNVEYVDPIDAFCGSTVCSPTRDEKILFRDTVHLSNIGATYLFDYMQRPLSAFVAAPSQRLVSQTYRSELAAQPGAP
jgi:peptidoglycan/LPS O-acetylase OafA/YrhL